MNYISFYFRKSGLGSGQDDPKVRRMFGTISRACGDGEGEPQLKGRRKVRVRQKLKKEYMGGVMAVGVWDKQTKSKWREFRGHTRSVK
jgi:hypothetical protein